MERPTPKGTGRVRAAVMASIVAGPMFMTTGLDFSGALDDPLLSVGIWIGLSLLSIPVAVSVAIVPVASAVMLGGWFGIRWPVSRNRLVWLAVGTVAGAPLIRFAADSLAPDAPLHAVIATALVIPLVARHFVAWRD